MAADTRTGVCFNEVSNSLFFYEQFDKEIYRETVANLDALNKRLDAVDKSIARCASHLSTTPRASRKPYKIAPELNTEEYVIGDYYTEDNKSLKNV